MTDVYELVYEAKKIVEECCGDVIGNIVEVKINHRAKSFWGRCHTDRATKTYKLEFSDRILKDGLKQDQVLSTAVHEVLHTCKNAVHHNDVWKNYAKKCMDKYPNLKISRTTNAASFGLEERPRTISYKYAIKCTECGMIHHSSKLSKSIKYPSRFRCRCGGRLERIK